MSINLTESCKCYKYDEQVAEGCFDPRYYAVFGLYCMGGSAGLGVLNGFGWLCIKSGCVCWACNPKVLPILGYMCIGCFGCGSCLALTACVCNMCAEYRDGHDVCPKQFCGSCCQPANSDNEQNDSMPPKIKMEDEELSGELSKEFYESKVTI